MELSKRLPISLGGLKRYRFREDGYMGVRFSIFRTGYTGEDGVEVVLPSAAASTLWEFLCPEDGPEDGIKPAGLGARDTLRLEAGMPLYGHELSEQVDPLSAGQSWCVDLGKDFIGAEALRKIDQAGPQRKLVGLVLEGRRTARQDGTVISGAGNEVGWVTSGTMSPTLDKSIAMGYVEASLAEVGNKLQVDISGQRVGAEIVPLPFYKRPR
jgi:aminomethyltransferase